MELQILKIDDRCTGCGACVSICPKNALTLFPDREGFYFPKVDRDLCINCHLCDKSCQVLDPASERIDSRRKYYMAKAAKESIVKSSSSGGAFSILADKVLSSGGVVYGARYDFENERLIQDSTENCSLAELRKSKYIESYTGAIFKDVGDKLSNGINVLYVGTPCQVEGLSQYLHTKRISRDNLILVQFVCHGVPANKFFTEYKHYEEKKHRSKLISFDFRPKIRGWRYSDWKMEFANGDIDKGPYCYYYYYYYYYFRSDNILRKSCYNCKRVLNETPDITIGDFWGIQKFQPENKDNDGISLVIAHNPKAVEILESINGFRYLKEIPEPAVDYIRREISTRQGKTGRRDAFMLEVGIHGYMKTVKRNAAKKIFRARMKDQIRKLFRR